ncbi:MAG: hypothetical protein JKY67_15205 [Pseudomonadales bacterium]|nr:hypothetical protein [Pseudomonadales bacterium]
MNTEFEANYRQTKGLIERVLVKYNESGCQCAYPRYRQIVSVDCAARGGSYMSHDTELFIDLSKPYFNVHVSELTDENTNERWVCKVCESVYEYGWSDFSIYVSRQKLSPVELKAKDIGSPCIKPMPLYLGLMGHSSPSDTYVIYVTYQEFKKYIEE